MNDVHVSLSSYPVVPREHYETWGTANPQLESVIRTTGGAVLR